MPSTDIWPQGHQSKPHAYQAQGYHPHSNAAPKRRNKPMFVISLIVLSAVFVYASVQLGLYLTHSYKAKQEEQMIQGIIAQNVTEEPSVPEALPSAEPATRQETAAPVQYHEPAPSEKPGVLIQFVKALSINPDTIGQLQMGESIRTYVVQRDNSFYLRHSFSGEYNFSGAIFLDVSCSIDLQSRNLIIHGHNMKDGTAFGKLSRFDDLDYLNKYPFIEFSTLYENARYIPFAAVYYSIDPQSDRYMDIYRVNAISAKEFMDFVTKLQLMSEYRLPVYVAGTDKILTVTTCASGDDNVRFAVFAVKRSSV